jgi:hypothetical protein
MRYVHVLQDDVKKTRAAVTVLRKPDNDPVPSENTASVPKLDRTAKD